MEKQVQEGEGVPLEDEGRSPSGSLSLGSPKTAELNPAGTSRAAAPGLRIIVAGSRTFHDYPVVQSTLDFIFKYDKPSAILTGGAAGADKLGEIWAEKNSIPIEHHIAKWGEHGKAAGPIRNREMASKANGLVAFWNGESRGTKNMIEEAEKRGLAVWIEEVPRVSGSEGLVRAEGGAAETERSEPVDTRPERREGDAQTNPMIP